MKSAGQAMLLPGLFLFPRSADSADSIVEALASMRDLAEAAKADRQPEKAVASGTPGIATEAHRGRAPLNETW